MNRTLGALTLASVTALLLGGLAPATADDLDDDLDSVAGRIAALSAQISDATAQRSSLAAQIKATNVRMDETVAALEEVQADVNELADLLNISIISPAIYELLARAINEPQTLQPADP